MTEDEKSPETFEFKQCASILKSTGMKAGDLRELIDNISEVSDNSVFHHTYQYFLKGHPIEYTSDFAHWVGEVLEERILAEQLSNIDSYAFASIEELKDEIIGIIDSYIRNYPSSKRALTGDEFYFNEAVTIVYPEGTHAKNLAEFLIALRYMDAGSIYYHFYEARVRLKGTDDFSNWIETTLGNKSLAEKIRATDLFMRDIEKTRDHLLGIVEEEVKKEMEKISL